MRSSTSTVSKSLIQLSPAFKILPRDSAKKHVGTEMMIRPFVSKKFPESPYSTGRIGHIPESYPAQASSYRCLSYCRLTLLCESLLACPGQPPEARRELKSRCPTLTQFPVFQGRRWQLSRPLAIPSHRDGLLVFVP